MKNHLLQIYCSNDLHPNKTYSSLDNQNGLPSIYSGGVLSKIMITANELYTCTYCFRQINVFYIKIIIYLPGCTAKGTYVEPIATFQL